MTITAEPTSQTASVSTATTTVRDLIAALAAVVPFAGTDDTMVGFVLARQRAARQERTEEKP